MPSLGLEHSCCRGSSMAGPGLFRPRLQPFQCSFALLERPRAWFLVPFYDSCWTTPF